MRFLLIFFTLTSYSNDFQTYQKIVEIFGATPKNWIELKDWTQKHFLRKNSQDHFSVPYTSMEKYKEELLPLFTDLKMINEHIPTQEQYDAIVVFGGWPYALKKRFLYLKELQKRYKSKVYYISGKRPLDPNFESAKEILKEEEGISFYTTQDIPLYQDDLGPFYNNVLEGESIQVVSLNMIETTKGLRRPNTFDTLKEFFSIEKGQNILFISHNPYIPYQKSVVEKFVNDYNITVNFEVVGPRYSKDIPLECFLDSLARTIYNKT